MGRQLLIASGILLAIALALRFLIDRGQGTADEVSKVVFKDSSFFWEQATPSKHGYLLTQNHLPLRAIARRPNVPLFHDKSKGSEESFAQIMQPWKPYYVYQYAAESGALLVSERVGAGASEARWVFEADVYCWTTREVLTIEGPVALYKTLDDARQGRGAVIENYLYPYDEHFEAGPPGEHRKRFPSMVGLPVLRREDGQYWAVIRSDPEPRQDIDRPYQVRWLHWKRDDPSVVFRLRVTRREFEDYIQGLRTRLHEYRYGSIDERASSRQKLVARAQVGITGEEEGRPMQALSAGNLMSRNEGIPKLAGGILTTPIQSDLESRAASERLKALAAMSSDHSAWHSDEVAYFKVERLP